jgi:hypothetical protein
MSGLRATGCGLRVTGCGLRVAGYGLRVAGCVLRVAGCGLRVASCGLRETGVGVTGVNKSTKIAPDFDPYSRPAEGALPLSVTFGRRNQ